MTFNDAIDFLVRVYESPVIAPVATFCEEHPILLLSTLSAGAAYVMWQDFMDDRRRRKAVGSVY